MPMYQASASTISQITCWMARCSSWARSVRSVGITMATSASARRVPPSRAVNTRTFAPCFRADPAALITLGEVPLVECTTSRSPALTRASTCREKMCSNPRSLPAAVSSDVSVVSAIAGIARRFFMYRTTYSVAMCCASAALPPLPQKYSVPPRRTVSRTIARALSSAGPSCSATRSAVAASSRRGPVKASDTLRHQLPQQLRAAFSKRRQCLLTVARLTRVLVGVSRKGVDGEQVERAFTIETVLGEQAIERAGSREEADVRRACFVGVGITAEDREHLPGQ